MHDDTVNDGRLLVQIILILLWKDIHSFADTFFLWFDCQLKLSVKISPFVFEDFLFVFGEECFAHIAALFYDIWQRYGGCYWEWAPAFLWIAFIGNVTVLSTLCRIYFSVVSMRLQNSLNWCNFLVISHLFCRLEAIKCIFYFCRKYNLDLCRGWVQELLCLFLRELKNPDSKPIIFWCNFGVILRQVNLWRVEVIF